LRADLGRILGKKGEFTAKKFLILLKKRSGEGKRHDWRFGRCLWKTKKKTKKKGGGGKANAGKGLRRGGKNPQAREKARPSKGKNHLSGEKVKSSGVVLRNKRKKDCNPGGKGEKMAPRKSSEREEYRVKKKASGQLESKIKGKGDCRRIERRGYSIMDDAPRLHAHRDKSS